MNFKLWLNEIVELQKPSSKVKKSNFIKNKGTNSAYSVVQFQWRTKLGNNVKLHFIKKENDAYDVIFYVNDTHFDNETAKQNRTRDPEVLSSVLHVLRNKADELNIKKLTFLAQKSEKDYKIIFNLQIEPLKTNILNSLKELLQFLETRKTQLIAPTKTQIELAKKFNRPKPENKPDINPNWKDKIKELIKKIEDEQMIGINDFEISYNSAHDEFKNIGYDLKEILIKLKKYKEVIQSNSPDGFIRHKNRRAEIYDKLIRKYFSDWNITRNDDYFELTR